MDYLFLDSVSWQRSQSLYHAAAYLEREVLLILRPATPYVCLGFHQDAGQEIDLDYAQAQNIPVFRREVGGGAVYLDGQQLFYQLVLRADHAGLPANKGEFYRKYLQPVVDTYREFGVPAEYKPVNDIIANGRKISGNGAAQIENSIVLVGNFIQDFNYEMMTRVLRVPDEKFRDKVFKTMSENLTTFLRETGKIPANSDLAQALVKRYEPLLGKMTPRELDDELADKADELFAEMHTPQWLLANDRRRPNRRPGQDRRRHFCGSKDAQDPGRVGAHDRREPRRAAFRRAHLRRFLLFPGPHPPGIGNHPAGCPLPAGSDQPGRRQLLHPAPGRIPRRDPGRFWPDVRKLVFH